MSSAIRNAGSLCFNPRHCGRAVVSPRMSMSAPAMDWRLSKQRFLLNGAASVALLAVLGNLAIAQQTEGFSRELCFKEAFVCFGIGVMLAASSSVVAFLIQNVAIAHPKDAEGRTTVAAEIGRNRDGRASLFLFAVGIAVAANAVGNLIGSLDMTAQRQADLQRMTSGLLPPPPRQCPDACLAIRLYVVEGGFRFEPRFAAKLELRTWAAAS